MLLQVDDTLVMTETLDSGSRTVVYVVFGAAVYDVEVRTVISNQPSEPVSMKVRNYYSGDLCPWRLYFFQDQDFLQ